jgi:hypothetical protein
LEQSASNESPSSENGLWPQVPRVEGFLFLELSRIFLRSLLGFRQSEPDLKGAQSAITDVGSNLSSLLLMP